MVEFILYRILSIHLILMWLTMEKEILKKDKDNWEYILKVPYTNDKDLDETLYDLMHEAESIADCRNGFTEMNIIEPATGKSW